MIFSTGPANCIAFSLKMPMHGHWTIEARLDSNPYLTPNAPFALQIDGAPFATGVVTNCDQYQKRWRFMGSAPSFVLANPLPPSFFSNTTLSQVLLALSTTTGLQIVANTNRALDNAVWLSSVSGWQWLQRMFPSSMIRSDLSGVLRVDPLPQINYNSFMLQDYSASTKRIQLAPQSTPLIQPGDQWTDSGSGLSFVIDDSEIVMESDQIRIVCGVR